MSKVTPIHGDFAEQIEREHKERKYSMITTIVMVIFHIGAVAALFMFNWKAVALAAVLYWISLSFGIGMGYHRLLTHRGYQCPKWFEYFVTVCGTIALEGGPIFWVATHRIHHQKSDQEGDPHTPRDGKWWAHMGWIIFGEAKHSDTKMMGKYAPDMAKDKFHVWLTNYHWVPLTTLGLIILAVGGWSYVCWAIFMRVCLGLHATWLVNSATHLWGKRRFDIRDDSRNNWWVALLTFGEGWHNNHHAVPVSARHGLAWYELDITWLTIKLFETLGVIRNVKAADVEGNYSTQAKAA